MDNTIEKNIEQPIKISSAQIEITPLSVQPQSTAAIPTAPASSPENILSKDILSDNNLTYTLWKSLKCCSSQTPISKKQNDEITTHTEEQITVSSPNTPQESVMTEITKEEVEALGTTTPASE